MTIRPGITMGRDEEQDKRIAALEERASNILNNLEELRGEVRILSDALETLQTNFLSAHDEFKEYMAPKPSLKSRIVGIFRGKH